VEEEVILEGACGLSARKVSRDFCAMQINCRVPFPERLMHRRRGWRDTPTLIQYEHDGPPGIERDSLVEGTSNWPQTMSTISSIPSVRAMSASP